MTLSTLKARKNGLTRRTGAFTLIELIVVIVIIGILAAVAAVSYNSFIAGAEQSSSESSAAQVSKTLQAKSALDQDTYAELAVSENFALDTANVNGGGAVAKPTDGWVSDAPADATFIQVDDDSAGTVTMRYADDQYYCDVTFDSGGVGTSALTAPDCTAIPSTGVPAL